MTHLRGLVGLEPLVIETDTSSASASEGHQAPQTSEDLVHRCGELAGSPSHSTFRPCGGNCSPHRPSPRGKRRLDPLRIPESVGLVEPTWVPYIWSSFGDATTNVVKGSTQLSYCSDYTGTTSGQSANTTHAGKIQSATSTSLTSRKKKLPPWSARHHVTNSKDNMRLPKPQRLYFDDQPHTRCRGGVYGETPGHRSRNFDAFCGEPIAQQLRNLHQRFERYPFSEVLTPWTPSSEGVRGDCAQPHQNEGSPELFWAKHLRSDRGDLMSHRVGGGGCGRLAQEDSDTKYQSKSPIPPSVVDRQHQFLMSQPSPKVGLPHFHVWCVNKFGSYVRLWRCLDVHHNMRIGQGQFLKGLQELGYSGDSKELFKLLHRDQAGYLLFHHFAPEAALAVAEMLHWARKQHGGLHGIGLLPHLDKVEKLRKPQFAAIFKRKGFLNDLAIDHAWELCDKDSDGYVSRDEAMLLDAWDYPEYLVADADPVAAEFYKRRLFDKAGGNALLAWRYLDKSCSMRVAWHDFRLACRKILPGEDSSRLAPAWRHLDCDLSGWLSLREFDQETYDQLARFAEWIHSNYGSVVVAFPKFLSVAGAEARMLTFTEFRQVCRKSGMEDVVTSKIYRGLDVDASGVISRQEVNFLDMWKAGEDRTQADASAVATSKE